MTAVYPGSFDPATYGHIDIITRASKLFDRLIVAVLKNSQKKAFFTVEERIAQLSELTKDIGNVYIASFSGLLVDFAKRENAKILVRGLRAVTDFEYEFQMALTNKSMADDIETVFLASATQHLYLSSSIVKEVAENGGNIDNMAPALIKNELLKKLNGNI